LATWWDRSSIPTRLNLIALEGTWGDIKLQPFRDFANRKAVELSADYLLKENKISGPIHAALIGTGPLPAGDRHR
jgi:hypothetical protein